VDCAERLVEAADEGGQIAHAEARVLIREVLVRHPDVQLDEDEGGNFRDLNQRAAQFCNKLSSIKNDKKIKQLNVQQIKSSETNCLIGLNVSLKMKQGFLGIF
jgi:hypothetical protein